MRTSSLLAGVALGAVIGLIVGYISGRRTSPAATVEEPPIGKRETPEHVEGRPPPPGTSAEVTVVAPSLAQRLRAITAIKSDVTCMYEAEQLFASLTAAELPAALAATMALTSNVNRSRMIGMLFRRWGELDGPGALAASHDLPARERIGAEPKALEGWARIDPSSAWAVARDFIAGNQQATWRMQGVLREFYRVDPARAMAEAVNASSDTARQGLRAGLIAAAAEDGTLGAVLQFAQQEAEPAVRDAWIKDVFSRWGSLDTDAPLNALKTIADPALTKSAMNGLLTGWCELDPAGALNYALENRNDPVVAGALGSIVTRAVPYSSESEMRSMIAEIVHQGAFDGIAHEVMGHLAYTYPTLALELAATVTEEGQRTNFTGMALSAWARNDLKSAASYFEAMTDLPTKSTVFSYMSYQTLRVDGGAATVARWIEGFSGQDRMRAVTTLVENQRRQPATLKPEGAAALARAISATPGLPAETLQQAQKLFGFAAP